MSASQTTWYNRGLRLWGWNNVDLRSDELKLMLVGPGYSYDKGHDFIGAGAGTPGGEEIVVTGYTGGFGGAGRKALANKSLTMQGSTSELVFDADDVSYGALGGGGGDVPVDAGIVVRELSSDADSELLIYVKFPQRMTDGTDFWVRFAAGGIWRLQNVIVP